MTLPHADRAAVATLLGREPAGRFEVVVRDVGDRPIVIRNEPLLADGTPMPTRYWLVGREEREQPVRDDAVVSAGPTRHVGAVIPFVELIAGWLLVAGLWIEAALVALGLVLITVTYGHLLKEPLYSFTGHVFPRLSLLVFVALMARHDTLSVDAWRQRLRAGREFGAPSRE